MGWKGGTLVTRADVAKLAQVSEATVSFTLSGKRTISEKTKERVFAAIEATGYKSNYAAKVLAGGRSPMVTMMTYNLFMTPQSQIDGALVDGIVKGVREAGFHSVIWPIFDDGHSDIDVLLQLNFSGGVILMNVTENDPRAHVLNSNRIPFVVLGRTNVGFSYNFVDRDFETVYKIAFTKLKELGHTRIGILSANTPITSYMKKAATSLKLKLENIDTVNTLEGGMETAKNFKRDYPDVTGIVSSLDIATIGFVNSSAQYGLSIPKDLSIIGVNMLEIQAESSRPKISTVKFDAFEMARSCGRMVVEAILAGKDGKSKKNELWIGDFEDRGSIAAPRRTGSK